MAKLAGTAPIGRDEPRFLLPSPMWLGLLVAVAVGIGLRSGGRGGPLVLEAPVVMHELNAPVSRAMRMGPGGIVVSRPKNRSGMPF